MEEKDEHGAKAYRLAENAVDELGPEKIKAFVEQFVSPGDVLLGGGADDEDDE